ncbi:hypothetical protein CK203_068888 [Vitis vinifera]|uniref:Uncharacterized protein n=1 Tax=Vitis vinifera TaxID=29760 RepID=A0A438EXN1_VITVI|nr:hypothetical protein CK203_068888 [Vitis vinifera]
MDAFWRKVICGKFGELEGGWCSKEVRDNYGVGLWKAIRLLWELIFSRILFVVGNGRRVKFWRDRWCRDEPLRDGWNPSFSRPLNDWEIETVECFLSRI